jgi:aminomethyltransferase
MLQTPLHDWHAAHGGRMVDFAGWDMPVQYTTISEEHHAVRKAAGLFDISHMGRLKFTGPDACRFLDHLVTNDVTKIAPGRIRYALVCNETGGVLDDVLVYAFDDSYLLVVNASNRLKILEWIEQQRDGFDVIIEDLTISRCMIAVQGPQAAGILSALADSDVAELKYYSGTEMTVCNQPALVSRTGYTGEDGFEVIIDSEFGQTVWDAALEAGVASDIRACGLGCRDTLRLEVGMPLYGHELDEATDPLSAGLRFAVKLKAGDFLGRDALLAIADQTDRPVRIGLQLEGRRIAREGATLHAGDRQVGHVTSGTFSPTLVRAIGMGYVTPDVAEVGTALEVDIRGKRAAANVVELPFYKRG